MTDKSEEEFIINKEGVRSKIASGISSVLKCGYIDFKDKPAQVLFLKDYEEVREWHQAKEGELFIRIGATRSPEVLSVKYWLGRKCDAWVK